MTFKAQQRIVVINNIESEMKSLRSRIRTKRRQVSDIEIAKGEDRLIVLNQLLIEHVDVHTRLCNDAK